ncbi:hypothetical protein, conserved [Eimeria necatrix]|uniref:Histone RNA hairpin-binding protein RNA-binding domain-containing protein n=1 Tax=Eimeria necatrix TaxID=51315 RepID=U6N7V7_9EIME|nr:hypothetical protein, conserved [Eimeria necatrix]CDJ69971.1 hypothetical protein, conserved [Eimeria necatrix]
MAAFRAGIRWADMSTESFSRSKTLPGSTAQAALLLQAEQADQSYAPDAAAALPEFENSQAGMNQYFLEAAALGADDSSKNGTVACHGADHVPAACPSDKPASSKASPDEDAPAEKMPGFRGLLVSAPNEGTSASGSENISCPGRREGNVASELLKSATLTPAKRNRRTSGAPDGGTSAVIQSSEAPAQDGSAPAPQEGTANRVPQSKRRKSTYGRRSADCAEQSSSFDPAFVSHGQRGKRRSARGTDRRRSGGTRKTVEGPPNTGLLLQMGAPAFLQLPGLVSPMFMPVGLPPGTAAPLPGLLHPQAVQKQQAMANSSKEKQEKEDEEEWHRRECARMKDIAIGKATAGYRNFLKQVGTERRSEGDPMTPDAKLRCSKAQFQRAYQKWRKQLHQYDAVGDESSTGTPSPCEAQSAASSMAKAENDPDTSPSGISDQQGLEAILAFNKECERAGL